MVGHSLGGSVVTALAQQSPQLASRVVIIDQAPEDGFEQRGVRAARQLLADRRARRSTGSCTSRQSRSIRDQYDDAFAPGYDISSGFDNPDQPVDDLRAMTYTAYKDTRRSPRRSSSMRGRSTSASPPSTFRHMVIFGAEDQIYDAQAAIARYRQNVPGAQTHLIPGAGPFAERRAAEPGGAA